MKWHRILLNLTLLLLATAWFSQNQTVYTMLSSHDIALVELATTPEKIEVGRETAFVVSYVNTGTESVSATYLLSVRVVFVETNEEIQNCVESVTITDLKSNERQEYHLEDCDTIFRAEGEHQIRVAFVPEGTAESDIPISGEYLAIDDANATNNGLTINVEAAPHSSNLPDGLGQLLAGLGMFFAIMAIMAVGTEVVIDSIKVALGLKSKVTAMEALERMERLIPGQLATLGVDVASQEQFESLTKNMRDTVQPISETPAALDALKTGNVNQFLNHLSGLGVSTADINRLQQALSNVLILTDENLTTLKKTVVPLLNSTSAALGKSSQVTLFDNHQKKFFQDVQTEVDTIKTTIEKFTIPANVDLTNLIEQFKTVQKQWHSLQTLILHEIYSVSARATTQWLTTQRSTLVNLGRSSVMDNFDEFVVPQLVPLDTFINQLGFAPHRSIENETRIRLEGALSTLDAQALQVTDQYIESLDNLLQGVEARRFEIQSPIRKLWRRLRNAGSLWGAGSMWGVFSVIGAIIMHLLLTTIQENPPQFWWGSMGWGMGLSAIFMVVLSLVGLAIYKAKNLDKSEGSSNTDQTDWFWKWLFVGQETNRYPSLLGFIELVWNWLRGDQDLHPQTFDQPKPFIIKAEQTVKQSTIDKLTPENAAQVVFMRTNQQQDEEKSRLRFFRLISLFVGLIIAYILQIDAAILLDKAVPGIEQIINSVLNIDGQIIQETLKWPWLDAQRDITAGIILTGFAAAAGSKFWHDRLSQLQATKEGAETAIDLLNQAKEVSGSVKQQLNT